MPIYIKEDIYGTRHSKYAANYRHKWQAAHNQLPTSIPELPIGHNVATFKLVERIPASNNNGEATPSWEKTGGKKSEGKATYITLPSLKREAKVVKYSTRQQDNINALKHYNIDHSHIKGFSEKPHADYHSEQTIGDQLAKGYRNINDPTATTDPSLTDHDRITGGKFWIKWIYTERIPCDSSRYKKPCDRYIEQLEKEQIEAGGPPITVFYKKAARASAQVQFDTTNAQAEIEKKNQYKKDIAQGMDNAFKYGLAKDFNQASQHELDLAQDLNHGLNLKHTIKSKLSWKQTIPHWKHLQNDLTKKLKEQLTALTKITTGIGLTENADKAKALIEQGNNLITRLETLITAAKTLEAQYIALYSDKAIARGHNKEFPIGNFISKLYQVCTETVNLQSYIVTELAKDMDAGIADIDWPKKTAAELEKIATSITKLNPEAQLHTLEKQLSAIKTDKDQADQQEQQQLAQKQQEAQALALKQQQLLFNPQTDAEIDQAIFELKRKNPLPLILPQKVTETLTAREKKEYTLLKLQERQLAKDNDPETLSICKEKIALYESRATPPKTNNLSSTHKPTAEGGIKRLAEQSLEEKPAKKLRTEKEEGEIDIEIEVEAEVNPVLALFEQERQQASLLSSAPLLNQLPNNNKAKAMPSHQPLDSPETNMETEPQPPSINNKHTF